MRAERWVSEASFFDRLAERAGVEVSKLHPKTLARYSGPRLRRWFNKEFRFKLLGHLRGKQVLDLGCGEGTNAVLLATRGAMVTGIDISPKSVELATQRARVEGVGDKVRCICSPIETADIADNSFDVIWGDGVLHHLIDELDLVMQRLTQWAKPGAHMVFSEPVNLNPTLRRIRKYVPVHTEATPDERPLEAAEIDTVKRYVPNLRMHYFSFVGRLDRFILPRNNYELASTSRRALAHLTGMVDYALLSTPGLHTLGAMAVMEARVRK